MNNNFNAYRPRLAYLIAIIMRNTSETDYEDVLYDVSNELCHIVRKNKFDGKEFQRYNGIITFEDCATLAMLIPAITDEDCGHHRSKTHRQMAMKLINFCR